MYVSHLEEYGLRCFIQLAKRYHDHKPTSSASVAELEGLSVDYVSKIFHLFRKHELVSTKRGVNGGFSLTKPPSEISLRDVLRALRSPKEELLMSNFCDQFKGDLSQCIHHCDCTVRPVWATVYKVLDELFSKIKIADLLKGESNSRQIVESLLKSIHFPAEQEV